MNWFSIFLLLVIVAYASIYCVVFVGGPSFYGDDTSYLSLAQSVVQGSFMQGPYIFSVRLLQVFPIALAYKLFGISMLSSSLWDIVSFIGSIIVAFLIGRELYDDYAGIVAALLLSFFPLIVMLAPTISDNIPMMFLGGLAVMSFVYATKRNSRLWYMLTGVFSVASPLVTPEGIISVYLVVLLLVIELARRRISVNRTTLFYIYGILASIMVLFAVNYATSGNPLVTLSTNLGFYSAVGKPNTIPSTNTDPMFYLNVMFPLAGFSTSNFNIMNIVSSMYVPVNNYSGLYFYALIVAAAYLIARLERRAYIPLLWFAFAFLYLEFGPMHVSISPFEYLLSYRLQRFLAILAIPLALTIAITSVRFARGTLKLKNKLARAAAFSAAPILIGFIVVTSIPINLFWYNSLVHARYDQLTIADYLASLPNSTKVYFSSSFSNLPIYMGYANASRLFVYDQIQDCNLIPANAYVVIPKSTSLFGLDYTPDPTQYCSSWKLVLYPSLTTSYLYERDVASMAVPFGAKLYKVGPLGQPVTVQQPQNTSVLNRSFNYFNLTGVGVFSNGILYNFITVNNVSSVNVHADKASASPGEPVILNVTFVGSFIWTLNNATQYYLKSALINVHYYGTELANQTGMLLDQNNGPWWKYVTQNGEPHQILYNDPGRYLRIQWNITPNATMVGKQLKLCGGYYAAYANTTDMGGWGYLFNALSRNQTRVVNSSAISIPSSNCVLLNVTAA